MGEKQGAAIIDEYSVKKAGLIRIPEPFASGVPEYLKVNIETTESVKEISYKITLEGTPREGDKFSFTSDMPDDKSVTDWTFKNGKWSAYTWESTLEEEEKPEN